MSDKTQTPVHILFITDQLRDAKRILSATTNEELQRLTTRRRNIRTTIDMLEKAGHIVHLIATPAHPENQPIYPDAESKSMGLDYGFMGLKAALDDPAIKGQPALVLFNVASRTSLKGLLLKHVNNALKKHDEAPELIGFNFKTLGNQRAPAGEGIEQAHQIMEELRGYETDISPYRQPDTFVAFVQDVIERSESVKHVASRSSTNNEEEDWKRWVEQGKTSRDPSEDKPPRGRSDR